MPFLTYSTNTPFFALSIYGNDRQRRFFSFLYIKSKLAFVTFLHPLSKLAEQLKTRILCDFKRPIYYKINFILQFFEKLLRHTCGLTWHTFRTCQHRESLF